MLLFAIVHNSLRLNKNYNFNALLLCLSFFRATEQANKRGVEGEEIATSSRKKANVEKGEKPATDSAPPTPSAVAATEVKEAVPSATKAVAPAALMLPLSAASTSSATATVIAPAAEYDASYYNRSKPRKCLACGGGHLTNSCTDKDAVKKWKSRMTGGR